MLEGNIPCPDGSVRLRPHGHTRTRTLRGPDDKRLTQRPRRARCSLSQVVLPAALSAHRADTLEVIGTALEAKATGSRYRTIAVRLCRPVSTVLRWLHRGA